MGNRGLETRNSKRSQYHPQLQQKKESNLSGPQTAANLPVGVPPPPQVTVAALEVQNVKRAINRYGTLPKGARIGAYLESLRQTDSPASQPPAVPNQKNGPLIELPPPPPQQSQTLDSHSNIGNNNNNTTNSMSPRAVAKAQPQMIRSNSSGGVTMQNSATQSLNKLQRHRTTNDGTMMTFSSFRGASGSPKRSFNSAEQQRSNPQSSISLPIKIMGRLDPLADLEFPPPPLDLPPPPEEFETPCDMDLTRADPMQMSISMTPSNDVSNTEPSVEEASSRFGVSLRKREPSTDSCSSLGSPATAAAAIIAEQPIEPQLDMKIVAEIKERAEQQQTKISNDVPNNNISKLDNKSVDHVSQLVNELAETMNLPKSLQKSNSIASQLPPKPDVIGTTNNFKAQLKKVEPKRVATASKDETNSIIDFKSRLRRVENNNENENTDTSADSKKNSDSDEKSVTIDKKLRSTSNDGRDTDSDRSDNNRKQSKKNGDIKQGNVQPDNANNRKKSATDFKKTDIKNDVQNDKKKQENSDATKAATAEDEDKRKSTGSISSLKKLWEAKEVGGQTTTNNEQGVVQLSPKLQSKHVITNNNKNGDEENDEQSTMNKKPAVPLKPTKLTSIYATPLPVKMPPDITANNKLSEISSVGNGTSNNANNTSPNTAQISREGILDLVQLLEGSLKLPINSISAGQWLQLSDKLNILQYSCVVFADKETMPPHSKFHFREVVTRVESQSRCLRSAGSKNIADNEKLVTEVGQSLKQISNALHR